MREVLNFHIADMQIHISNLKAELCCVDDVIFLLLEQEGNQGWQKSNCSKNSQGSVKDYSLVSLTLELKIQRSNFVHFMIRPSESRVGGF